jgi:hypothetical protein
LFDDNIELNVNKFVYEEKILPEMNSFSWENILRNSNLNDFLKGVLNEFS